MMIKITTAMAILMLGLMGCSGPIITSPSIVVTAAPVKPKLPIDQQQYKDTYGALTCRANLNYDPVDDMAIIHEPVEFIKGLVENEDNRIKYYKRITDQFGYPSIAGYLEKDEHFRITNRRLWESLRDDLLNSMDGCGK
jgi:hypothetical protein